MIKLLKRLFQRSLGGHAALLRTIQTGQFYRITNKAGQYYSTCHTTGGTIWVDDVNQAEVINSGEVRQLFTLSAEQGIGPWVLHLVPRSDPRHPLHHMIPAVTSHYTIHRTVSGEWFARATINGTRYESLAWESKRQAERDARSGSMFDNVRNHQAVGGEPIV